MSCGYRRLEPDPWLLLDSKILNIQLKLRHVLPLRGTLQRSHIPLRGLASAKSVRQYRIHCWLQVTLGPFPNNGYYCQRFELVLQLVIIPCKADLNLTFQRGHKMWFHTSIRHPSISLLKEVTDTQKTQSRIRELVLGKLKRNWGRETLQTL
jgi:hypothetical protein